MFGSTSRVSLVLIVLLIVFTSTVHAVTITVMRDGTGDYVQIQPALDAVASGDTLLVGPGDYAVSNSSYIPGYSWDVDVFAYVRVPELTIIGAGSSETIIGPKEYIGSTATYDPKGIVWLEGTELRLSGVTIQNCYEGMHATNAPIVIDDCRFVNNRMGIAWLSEGVGGSIKNCVFESDIQGQPLGAYLLGSGSGILVEDCFFDGAMEYVKNLESVTFRRCEIQNVVVGLEVHNGTHCIIDDCRINNCENVGVVAWGYNTVCDFEESEISSGSLSVYVDTYSSVNATNTIFTGGTWAVFDFNNSSFSQISNCHLFRGSGPYIKSDRHPSIGELSLDFSNNYWGTTDPAEIRMWIWDGVNDPDNTSTIIFEPFHGGPIQTESISWDQLKALYR